MDSSTIFISHKLVFIVVTILFTASMLFAFFFRPAEFEKTRIKLFFSILGSIAVLLVGLNLVLTSTTFEYNRLYTRTLIVKQVVEKQWLHPNYLIANTPHLRPEFVASLNYNNLALYETTKKEKNDKSPDAKAIIQEQMIATVLLQVWEDFFDSRAFDKTGDVAWLSGFLVWAQSPYLKNNYQFLKHDYEETTIRLADILFEYAAKLPVPNPDSALYTKTAKKMLEDPRIVSLIKETDEMRAKDIRE